MNKLTCRLLLCLAAVAGAGNASADGLCASQPIANLVTLYVVPKTTANAQISRELPTGSRVDLPDNRVPDNQYLLVTDISIDCLQGSSKRQHLMLGMDNEQFNPKWTFIWSTYTRGETAQNEHFSSALVFAPAARIHTLVNPFESSSSCGMRLRGCYVAHEPVKPSPPKPGLAEPIQPVK